MQTTISIVTGASSGIGAAIATELHSRGDTVLIVARSVDRLDLLASVLGERAEVRPADLTDPSDVERLANEIVQDHPVIDNLVNCAGARPDRILTTGSYADNVRLWAEQMAVNLSSAFYVSYALAQHVRKPGGAIVNIGSVAAQTGGRRAGSAGYAASKAGMHGMSLALSRELAPLGVTCNCVEPGFVADTGFTGSWGPEVTEPLISETPVGRAGTPADIAATVAFLTSGGATFITGQRIPVNGGLHT